MYKCIYIMHQYTYIYIYNLIIPYLNKAELQQTITLYIKIDIFLKRLLILKQNIFNKT